MNDTLDISLRIKDLGVVHIDSFNYVVHAGIRQAYLDIDPVYTETGVKISVSNAIMRRLEYPMDTRKHKRKVFPSEARLRAITYYAELDVQLCYEKEEEVEFSTRTFYVPVMLKSDLCFLNGLQEDVLISVKEDFNDPGGYFIVKGKERIFRHFVVPKRNYPLVMTQNNWKSLKENYSQFGIIVRSVKDEHIFSTVSLHLLNNGDFEVRFFYNSTSYFIQVMLILKALMDKCDVEIFKEILKYDKDFPSVNLKNMLRDLHDQNIHSHNDARVFLGNKFHPVLNIPRTASCFDAVSHLLKKSLFIHLDNFEDKFQFLCFSLCKLRQAAVNTSLLEDQDNPVFQELLLSGQTYLLIIKEGIISYLKSVRNVIERKGKNFVFKKDVLLRCSNQASSFTPSVASMIATGNFPGRKYGLKSDTGFTISLKRTNMFQLAAQFTAICKFSIPHFLKQTRSYYPESWGFLCPTQTPEGEKCGLQNYLASQCRIVSPSSSRIEEGSLFNFGIIPCSDPIVHYCREIYPVFVDGKIVGWINKILIHKLLLRLRQQKSLNSNVMPYHSEIVYVSEDQAVYPGIYLFSTPCRMIRKIFNCQTKREEYIGILEQVFLSDVTLTEVIPANILGLSARMIPFCEYNAAVRNIFSSEKCKQALGLPFLNFSGRSDSKMHQLMYSQSPLVSNNLYSESNFDFYPYGTNVIVAVISYSGYDMEDAIVLNKASVERGLMENIVYKTVYFDFDELAAECICTPAQLEFKRDENDIHLKYFLDKDGLPFVGIKVKYNDPILRVYNKKNQEIFVTKQYLERYDSYIHSVRVMGDVSCSTKNIPKNSKKISVTFRVRKIPAVGDKFNNRHGCKGICSALMSPEDLPFTANGMIPDVLLNPHGLPSRMPIGMLYEMAMSKAKISIGQKYIVEPFASSQSRKIYKEIGDALVEGGLNRWGTETFYSGTSGRELEAQIFSGSMYFLRLHHMVEDKYQVRSVGPVDERTNQPINPGLSGAIRFGEMERDAILSHGAAVLTRDRLLLSSDVCSAFVCSRCHLLTAPIVPHPLPELRFQHPEERKEQEDLARFCRLCQISKSFKIQIPFVLCYLVCELAVLGVNVKFSEK